MDVDTLPGLLGLSNARFGRAKYIRRNVNVLINVVKESTEFLHSLNNLAVHTSNMSKVWQANKSAKEMAGWPNDLDSAQVRGKSAIEMAGAKNSKRPKIVSRHGGEIMNGVFYSRDSLENGIVNYKKILLDNANEQDADSISWVNSFNE